ncbi:type I secretion outer membrane protein, TolC family [Prosthecochloris aestuarii DSM 271]|uniref:Type I secretion outer membrane protein, TolC family n=1 Tax=Prosthecochloris aestuarii (strain DSM 271 / SK 413) TaxID=290512 RepID=B4S6A3_PROA2|nr:TolC family outer membrane protein [Prosthecochloris aestuarii]ACF47205.1 type I secretion outer membrane protein, TolC family [Prosthecochloris aestuarii DSM 271]
MTKPLMLLMLSVLCGLGSASAESLDLRGAWEQARSYDARLRVAEAEYAMQQEEIAKARAALRPNIQAQSSRGRNSTRSSSLAGTSYYNTESSSITLKQSLFNLGSAASYKQAKAIAAKSGEILRNESNDLMVRTVEAYFNVLYAEEGVEVSRARVAAAAERLKQARRALKNGLGTVTAVDEAEARYDSVVADEIEARNSDEFNRRELERLTGIYARELRPLSAGLLPLDDPDPVDVDVWLALAMEKSPEIGAAEEGMNIARRELEKNRGAAYPSLDLVAGRSYSVSETSYTIDRAYDTYSLMLQLKVPMYTGGYISASVRQARVGCVKAEEEFSWYERQVVADIRRYYHAVLNAVLQVRAYEKAVISRETACRSTKKGVQAGLSTRVDVLESRVKLLTSRQDLAKARYQYIINLLMLKKASGLVSESDIDEIQSWLKSGEA